jgi:hypothetical protein
VFFFIPAKVVAQHKFLHRLDEKIDTNYIALPQQQLTVRLIGSSKTSNYKFIGNQKRLTFNANNSYNGGIGITYRFIGINLLTKLPGAINNDDKQYGKTRKLDMQAFVYPRKLVFELYVQWYKGFYVKENNIFTINRPNALPPLRPDVNTLHIGTNASYVFNAKRFSFRSAFMQNELQKKSAGTFLLGGGIHFNSITGDSALFPTDVSNTNFGNSNQYNEMGSLNMGVLAGYGYTKIIAQHFFITGIGSLGLGGSFAFAKDNYSHTAQKALGIMSNLSYKIAVGYNTPSFYAGLYYLGYLQTNPTPLKQIRQQYEPGMARLVVAKRFHFHPRWVKKTKTDAVLDVL